MSISKEQIKEMIEGYKAELKDVQAQLDSARDVVNYLEDKEDAFERSICSFEDLFNLLEMKGEPK